MAKSLKEQIEFYKSLGLAPAEVYERLVLEQNNELRIKKLIESLYYEDSKYCKRLLKLDSYWTAVLYGYYVKD